MLFFHASRLRGRLWLWAESSGAHLPSSLGSDPGRSGGDGATGDGTTGDGRDAGPIPPATREGGLPRPLPFDPGPELLGRVLSDLRGGFLPAEERFAPLVAWLPTRDSRPIPSSPLVEEAPGGSGRIRLRPWRVTALALDPEEVLTLLVEVEGGSTLAPGVPVTSDLAYWRRGLELALRLGVTRHLLPGLDEDPDGAFRARWKPLFRDPDLEALIRLSREMPGAARALALPEDLGNAEDLHGDERIQASNLPADAPLELLRGFVAELADHLLRSAQWPGGILPGPAGAFLPDDPLGRAPPPLPSPGERDGDASDAASSLDERWLHALKSPDPRVPGDEAELRDLERRIEEWRRPLLRVLDAPWRLCVQLDEPEPPPDRDDESPEAGLPESALGPWRLRFLLQDATDPSLLVPLERIWRDGTGDEIPFVTRDERFRERLFHALGQAARLSDRVDEALEEPEPEGIELDARGAHDFLRDEAPLLREAGFRLRLPAWWTRDRRRLRPSVRGRVRTPSEGVGTGVGLDGLLDIHWELALGDEPVSREELATLARLKAPLVRLRGRWVEVDGEELREALARIEEAEGEGVAGRRVLRMALGAEKGPGGLPVTEVRGEGKVGELLEGIRESAEFRECPAPEGLEAELRPYQKRGYSWLRFLARWGLGACLADDMGLGKTVQTLALIQADREAAGDGSSPGEAGCAAGTRSGPRPVLVVAPTSVVTNWTREAVRFTPCLDVRIHHGPDRPSGDEMEAAALEADVVITTYALLHRDVDDLGRIPWRGLVLDEAQNVKNPETKRARAARSLDADIRVALTGTPVENHVGDLWSIMEILNPGLLESRASFRRRFLLPIQAGRDPEATARLRRITGPFVLRRLKTDRSVIRDLPERIESKVFCTLTREQASLYAAVLRELDEGLSGDADGIERKGLVLAALTRLKQICNHPAHFLDDGSAVPGRSGKVERLVELLDEMREAEGRALIFTQYTRMGEILRDHLQERYGRPVPFLHGGVSRKRREEMVDHFQDDHGPELFLLSLKAGGTGLNLTAANHVFLFDRWWNPAVEAQAADRAFRIGQRRNVQVHTFVCTGTLEERIDEIVEGKREVARKVVGTGEGWLTELSDDDLREVLALDLGAADVEAEEATEETGP